MAKMKYNLHFTMVCPNTVGTGMFSGSKMVAGTKLLKADDVTAKIISGIRKNRAMVAVPSFPVKILTPLAKLLLPVRWMDGLNRMMGMWDANDTWIGPSCNTIKKGPTSLDACKPLICMVGDTGFEPVTSTV